MRRSVQVGIALPLALVGAISCSDWLTGPGLSENPNSPVGATAAQQLIAVQASAWTRLEGQMARNGAGFTQQIVGSNNQQLTYITQYNYTEADVGTQMTGNFTGGGLVGLRNVQAVANAAGDPVMEGIAKGWEGFLFGFAASAWGDLPYSEAVTNVTTPKLDRQEDLYAAVQQKLDTAIALLQGAPTTGNCEPADVVYCGTGITRAQEITRWIKAMHTMKARFYLHLAERNGAAAYALALAEALQGIDEVPTTAAQAMHGQAPGDFRSLHGNTLDQDGNIWASFLTSRQDLVAGNVMIQLLQSRTDPRLAQYFDPNASGQFVGRDRNNISVPAGAAASVINTSVRRLLTFRQPLVTWAERQLIIAEAECAPNVTTAPPSQTCTGSAAAVADALVRVNSVRTAVGMAALGAFSATPLVDIITEKYIAQFQNMDVWNDYKRTCLPATIRPMLTAAEIPGRIPYAQAERNTNPNIPAPNAYPTGTSGVSPLRNWNDPNACP